MRHPALSTPAVDLMLTADYLVGWGWQPSLRSIATALERICDSGFDVTTALGILDASLGRPIREWETQTGRTEGDVELTLLKAAFSAIELCSDAADCATPDVDLTLVTSRTRNLRVWGYDAQILRYLIARAAEDHLIHLARRDRRRCARSRASARDLLYRAHPRTGGSAKARIDEAVALYREDPTPAEEEALALALEGDGVALEDFYRAMAHARRAQALDAIVHRELRTGVHACLGDSPSNDIAVDALRRITGRSHLWTTSN
ncbi:hypothetical protein [Embleya sp. NPDC059237]|uniref:hypothetical protein n=1 Tax=Embleya sp. NPDC059237 TaxID=3346784 RepID=UPI0036B24470